MKQISILIISFLFAFTANAIKVVQFNQEGVLVDIHSFYKVTGNSLVTNDNILEISKDYVPTKDVSSGLALVTKDGVYAFLELKANKKLLKDLKPGVKVKISGLVLESAKLLYAKNISIISTPLDFDISIFSESAGKELTLTGINKCQCGLQVGDMPNSCRLGHLHHLEKSPGEIYHYLESEKTDPLFIGKDYHFTSIKVKAILLPGNYLYIKELEKL